MTFQLNALWIISAAAFSIAALLSLRNHFLVGKRSNLWLWFAVALGMIGVSRAVNLLITKNPLWGEVVTALLLVSAVVMALALVDFDKEVNLCISCGSSTSDLPAKEAAKEKKKKAEKQLRGF
ncbi:hypothetical protein HYU16_01845 [Candidatus Woesearchaeota archaeon]|nr:hypothetical protein [Candidatus Woesearchaeota archaeon]MBI2550170.1 hypothetical protein [Candidatus Woesearchaeota archaeon]